MTTKSDEHKKRRGRPPAASGTRERILDTAIELLSKNSYEETGLRDIASAAGVDTAYVHRCFGSKERLFANAVSAAVKPKDLFEGTPDRIPGLLAWDLLAHRGRRIKGLDIIVRSMTSRQAGPIVRDFIANEAVEPLAKTLGVPTTQAALIAAVITGVAILRNVIGLEQLGESEGGDLERLLAHVIRETVRGPEQQV
jgi:AcrR family transcriptional regulator